VPEIVRIGWSLLGGDDRSVTARGDAFERAVFRYVLDDASVEITRA